METSAVTSSLKLGDANWSYVSESMPTSFEYFTQRYYHHYQVENCKGIVGNHCRLLQHSNGLCILCVDPTHQLMTACSKGSSIVVQKVEFCKGKTPLTPESIQVVGKRKKNALVCQTDTKLCTITLSDGTEYPIPACLNGFVLELNAKLMTQPNMVSAAPMVEGFLAIINPSAKADLSIYPKIWAATGGDAAAEEED